MDQIDLSGKKVLITGGTSGIGKATARIFLKHRAEVIITSRSEQKGDGAISDLSKMPGKVSYIQADISQPGAISHLFSQIDDLDIAVNNAGMTGGVGKTIVEVTEEEYDLTMNTNLKGLWICMKNELLLMERKASGSIVNVSSINGLGGVPNGSIYAATKAGVLALTKSAALEYARLGIKINAVVPGAINTAMLAEAISKQSGPETEESKKLKKTYTSHIPKARLGNVEEVAEAILWLGTSAPEYMVGHSLVVDGGLSTPYV